MADDIIHPKIVFSTVDPSYTVLVNFVIRSFATN